LSWQRLKYGQEANTTTVADYMLESTGLYGASTLRLVEIATGQVIETLNVDSQFFAEGCTYYEMPDESETDSLRLKVVQLTWRSGTGFVYELFLDAAMSQTEDVTVTTTTAAVPFGLEQVGTFDIDTTNGEGWGIVYHPTLDQFIVSDGTDNLHFWELRENPAGENGNLIFERVRTQQVTQRFSTADSWTGVVRLNELEWDPYSKNGTTILANVWQTDYIVRIRLEDGKVTHRYDMSSLDRQSGADVLNGIAAVWDSVPADPSANNQFWVTGKRWDSMYRVRFEDD
jgi:glutamine cyclotransferase